MNIGSEYVADYGYDAYGRMNTIIGARCSSYGLCATWGCRGKIFILAMQGYAE